MPGKSSKQKRNSNFCKRGVPVRSFPFDSRSDLETTMVLDTWNSTWCSFAYKFLVRARFQNLEL